MTDQLTQILTPVFLTIISALGSIAIYAIKVFADKAKAHIAAIENDTNRNAISATFTLAEKLINTAVLETNQTLVNNLKTASADRNLTTEETKIALQQTYNKAKILIGEQTYAELNTVVPDVEAWILANIEATIAKSK
jgi:hypothetical protein